MCKAPSTKCQAPSATYLANIKINLCKPWIIRRAYCALKRRVKSVKRSEKFYMDAPLNRAKGHKYEVFAILFNNM